jgi:AcrR family transcriptional regulator
MAGRRSDADARRTREAILDRAADVASVAGMEGLRIGAIAADVGLSKGGVLGHFATKEELQLATLRHAVAIFADRVWAPIEDEPEGMPRLIALTRSWSAYVRSVPFTGGCFVAAASFEFDDRSGPVHEQLARSLRAWRRRLVHDATVAVRAGDLPAGTDPEVVAFTLEALADHASPQRALHEGGDPAGLMLRAMQAALGLPAEAPVVAA